MSVVGQRSGLTESIVFCLANTLLAGTKMPPANARLILDAYFDADRDWNIAVRATFERFEDLREIIRFTEDHHRCQAGLGYEFLISSATPGSMILPAYVEQERQRMVLMAARRRREMS